jgi:hypothetical protein
MSLKRRGEGETFIQTCVMMDKPIKYNLQRLEHTSVSHLVNTAAEDYLRRYVESEKDITVT